MDLCYIEDSFIPLKDARLPLTDFIIQRGIGVFDSITTHDKRPIRLGAHLKRLERSASEAGLDFLVEYDKMRSIIHKGIDMMKSEVVVRPYVTGGDYFDNKTRTFTAPRSFIIFQEAHKPAAECYSRGVALRTTDADRPMPHTKSINYMASFINQKKDKDAFETLYAPAGQITESSKSSFFLFIGGKLVTAPLSRVLAGTTRELVISIASELGISLEERCPLIKELSRAEEAFITGSVKEILPVVRIGGTTIGNGKPGPVTRRIHKKYLEDITQWLE